MRFERNGAKHCRHTCIHDEAGAQESMLLWMTLSFYKLVAYGGDNAYVGNVAAKTAKATAI